MDDDTSLSQRYQTDVGFHDPGQVDLLAAYLQRFDRENTRRAYQRDIAQFFGREHLTADDVVEASFLHLNRYIEELEAQGLKATSIRRKVSAIRGFFDWLQALEVVERNPANSKLLRKQRTAHQRDRKIVYLTPEQVKRLLRATEQAGEAALRDQALIRTLLHCVLRRSEAAAMDVEHVRPLGRYWIVDLPHAKGGDDQFVKIPGHVVEEIDAMRAYYGITEGPLWRSLSNNRFGKRLSTNGIYEVVKRTAARAGLSDDVGAHTLRHTGCTLAIEAGATVQQVKAHARHKNLETTMIYVHQREKLRDSAADFIRVDDESPKKRGT